VLFARFPLEIHAWTIPLLFATGWVIGWAHFRDSLRKRHPDLFEEWRRRREARANGGDPRPEGKPRDREVAS
jgi:hypothetical protein